MSSVQAQAVPRTGRKPTVVQAIPARDHSPSPTSFRDRQPRTVKAASMPIVPSLGQVLSIAHQHQHQQQPSPTSSTGTGMRHSPPPMAPPELEHVHGQEHSANINSPPPPPTQSYSSPNVRQHIVPPPPPQHSLSQPNIHDPLPSLHDQLAGGVGGGQGQGQSPLAPSYARPVPHRVAPAKFLSQQFHHGLDDEPGSVPMTATGMGTGTGAWPMTDDLQPAEPGTSGVAYAGGAHTNKVPSLSSMPSVGDPGSSPRDREPAPITRRHTMRERDRESPKNRDAPQSLAQGQSQGQSLSQPPSAKAPTFQSRTPDGPGPVLGPTSGTTPSSSPPYERERERDAYPGHARVGTPSGLRKSTLAHTLQADSQPQSLAMPMRDTPPGTKLASNTPPLQAMKTRTPDRDRSLPVQEEPEDEHDPRAPYEHDARGPYESRYPSHHHHQRDLIDLDGDRSIDGRTSRAGTRPADDDDDDDDEETMNEQQVDDVPPPAPTQGSTESEGFTPRSPTADLPQYAPSGQAYAQNTIRAKNRGGSTDMLGMRTIDASTFDRPHDDIEQPAPQQSYHHHQHHAHAHPQPQPHPHSHGHGHTHARHSPPPQISNTPFESFYEYPTAAYLHYLQSSTPALQMHQMHPRPDAPIPPSSHSLSQPSIQGLSQPSPSPAVSSMPNTDNGPRPVPLPPTFSPAPALAPPPVAGSPYPYPFTHVRRNMHLAATAAAAQTPSLDFDPAAYDPNGPSAIQEQLALQMQIYALNNAAGAMTDSTFSPAATPFPGAVGPAGGGHVYNPWAYLQASRAFKQGPDRAQMDSSMSLRSSPSHEPVPLPLRRRAYTGNLRTANGAGINGGANGGAGAGKKKRQQANKPPPRVDSTQPRETSPELSSGEETSTVGEDAFEQYDAREGRWVDALDLQGAHEAGEWVDEEEDEDEDDMLGLEFHPAYVKSVAKRRRRWTAGWEHLLQAFQELDRQTDATLVLLASPSHSTKLHAITSRAIKRDPSLRHSPPLAQMRAAFDHIASQRRATRSRSLSLVDRLGVRSVSGSGTTVSSPGDGASSAGAGDGSSPTDRENDLQSALQAALGSLGALGTIYEQREARWREEMRRQNEDRERVELLLTQALGVGLANGTNISMRST